MKILLLLLASFSFINLKAESLNCSYLQQLSADATQTQQRAALLSCRELMEQKTLLLAAEVKYKEIKRQLANPKKDSELSASKQEGFIDIGKMMQSTQVFLLSVSGFKNKRKVKLFYQGNYFFLAEGEIFPGGEIKSVSLNSALVLKDGKKRRIHLTTLDEMRVSLGLAPKASRRSRILPIGRVQ